MNREQSHCKSTLADMFRLHNLLFPNGFVQCVLFPSRESFTCENVMYTSSVRVLLEVGSMFFGLRFASVYIHFKIVCRYVL